MLDSIKYFFQKKSKVFIPFHEYAYIGGPSTFMQNLKRYLELSKYPYTKDVNKIFEVNSIFFPIEFDIERLEEAKKRGIKVIQRVAGVYHPYEHGEEYKKLNSNLEYIYKNLSDIVVFQGEYSKSQFFNMFGEKDQGHYKIIVNGVDKNIFYPPQKIKSISPKSKITFVVTGNFRKKVMIEPVVKALDEVRKHYNIELKVVGPIKDDSLIPFFERDYISNLGVKTIKEIADVLRGSDIFIHSKINDICPNSVLEAISVGIPVVGFDSGGLRELVKFSPGLLAPVSKDLFQIEKDFDYKKLKEKLILCIENYDYYRNLSMQNTSLFDFRDCVRGYVEIFDQF